VRNDNRKRDFQRYKEKWGLDRFYFFTNGEGHTKYAETFVFEIGEQLPSIFSRLDQIKTLPTLIRRKHYKFILYNQHLEFQDLQALQQYALTLKLAGI
jgi:hypothetical protein